MRALVGLYQVSRRRGPVRSNEGYAERALCSLRDSAYSPGAGSQADASVWLAGK
jgi:hypothetical protein